MLIDSVEQAYKIYESIESRHHNEQMRLFEQLKSIEPEIINMAIEVFEDEDKAANWIFSKNIRSLGFKPPISYMAEGDREHVTQVLGAIQYGVFL